MKLTLAFSGLVLLLTLTGCTVGVGGAYGEYYEPAPVYVGGYYGYHWHHAPYDRDHYWDRHHYWERHRYWHHDHD